MIELRAVALRCLACVPPPPGAASDARTSHRHRTCSDLDRLRYSLQQPGRIQTKENAKIFFSPRFICVHCGPAIFLAWTRTGEGILGAVAIGLADCLTARRRFHEPYNYH